MSEAFIFLSAPFVMCLILVGIHCYLGLHILARGVIFVDLALAQVAALGTTLAYLLGHDHADTAAYFISLGTTLIAALFFALSNRYKHKVSQEAIIGIMYAFASAAVVLTVDKMSHGAEHIKYALVGQLLWVTWGEVGRVFLIYSGVSLIHFACRKQLMAVSFGKKASWFWDFVFYALFGVIITSSVHVAGVLLVFAFLIVPSLLGQTFFSSTKARLIFGWSVGFILCFIGMILSYALDMPAGALIVVLFTMMPLFLILFLPFRKKALLKN